MTTLTARTEFSTPALRQRRMEKGLLFNYWVLSPYLADLAPTTKYSAIRAEEDGAAEALLIYRMDAFEVDGIHYPGQRTGAMISIRPTTLLFSGISGDSFSMFHICGRCNKPFELNECLWLRLGSIECVCIR